MRMVKFFILCLLMLNAFCGEVSAFDDPNGEEGVLPAKKALTSDGPNYVKSFAGRKGSSTEMYYTLFKGILIVSLLGVGAYYASRKFGRSISNRPGRQIRIVESAHLGPKRSLHLVNVRGREILIGCTGEHISSLADVTSFSIGNEDEISETE